MAPSGANGGDWLGRDCCCQGREGCEGWSGFPPATEGGNNGKGTGRRGEG